MDDAAEELHFHECIIAFREYFKDILPEFNRRMNGFKKIDSFLLEMLPTGALPEERLKNLIEKASLNQDILINMISNNILANDCYIQNTLVPMINSSNVIKIKKDNDKITKQSTPVNLNTIGIVPGYEIYSKPHNSSKIRTLLHQISREWSKEGQSERDACFLPILNQLETHVKVGSSTLCPGVGLGRLAVEIVSRGYSCQGNEFSYIMLFAADYILNHTEKSNQTSIYPWLDNSCNILNSEDQLKCSSFPDVSVKEMKQKGCDTHPKTTLSMVAGEFLQLYQPLKEDFINSNEPLKESMTTRNWDCIVTCFFLDTAPNVFEYIQKIYDLLEPGGIWINHGPLLWHWCCPTFGSNECKSDKIDERYNQSIELSYSEIKHFLLKLGFEFLHESNHETTYSSNPNSMMKTVYKTILFTCKKPSKK